MLTRQLIAWCSLGEFHDGEYRGPKHPCPANPECADGKDHYLRPRRAWVCSVCGFAWFSEQPPETCNHPLGP